MNHLRSLIVILAALVTPMQAICAQVSYKLTDSESHRVCSAVLGALEKARLATKSNLQICEIINSPVTDILQGKDFQDIRWVPAPPITRSEKERIAKKIYKSGIPKSGMSLSMKYEPRYIAEVRKILSKDDVIVEQAYLKYGHEMVHAVRLRRRRCTADYKIHGDIPAWGFFTDRLYEKGLPTKEYAPGGNLFYFNNRLLTFSIMPDFWVSESDIKIKQSELGVAVWSADANIYSDGNTGFTNQLVCSIYIHRQA